MCSSVETLVAAGGTTITLGHGPQLDVPPMFHSSPPPLPLTSPRLSTRLFHPAQPHKAYQPVPYAWPQILTTPENVAPRLSGMDPKPGARRATREGLSLLQAQLCAATGTTGVDAPPAHTSSGTSVQGAEARIMGLRGALELRKNQAITPYKVEAWESLLRECNLYVKYPDLIDSLHKGFDPGIRPIYLTSTPPNSPTLLLHPEAYQEMVANEFSKGRYIGPCSRQEVESLIGPFQSSPLSWVPKPGKPGKFRAVHNFSFPHTPTATTASINCSIDADMFPCTWGTFDTICFTIFNLPPGSQAAIRDVAEAYRTIPVTSDQWPGLVVRLLGNDEFAINLCNDFGLTLLDLLSLPFPCLPDCRFPRLLST